MRDGRVLLVHRDAATTTGRCRRASSRRGRRWEDGGAARGARRRRGSRASWARSSGRSFYDAGAACRRRSATAGWRPAASRAAQNEVDEVRWAQLRRGPRPARATTRRPRGRQPLAVAHLRRVDAPALLGLAPAVGGPAGALVEEPRARVVLQHPERRLVVVAAKLGFRSLDQRAPGARRPVLGIDVDRVQLADPVLVAARADRGEADHVPVVLGDERRPARGRSREPVAPAPRADEAAAVELLHREHVPVGDLPRPLLDARDRLGVVVGLPV